MEEGLQASKKRKNMKPRTKIPLLVRMIGSREGLKLGIICVKHGSAKERKKIVKGLKDHVRNLAFDQYGSIFFIRGLQPGIKELVLNQYGRIPILQLLHPQCPCYLGQENLKCLDMSVASLCEQDAPSVHDSTKDSEKTEACENNKKVIVGGKKDGILRRRELLIDSGFAESLIETCIENVSELLKSNFGKEVLFEVVVGGESDVLQSALVKLQELHKSIASVAAFPKVEEDEHVFENFHSSRIIRKLILESPTFVKTLWKTALEGKCEKWAQGHSGKLVAAFLESKDSEVKSLSESELKPLVDRETFIYQKDDHLSSNVEKLQVMSTL